MRVGDSARILAFVRAVVAAGKADGFRLTEVFPRHATRQLDPLAGALHLGLVERVTERVGAWFYRLTPAGVAAAEAGDVPRPTTVPARLGDPRTGSLRPGQPCGGGFRRPGGLRGDDKKKGGVR